MPSASRPFANPYQLLWLIAPLCLAPSLHAAHAYLDPNTGSYAIQIAIGIVFGGFYACKSFIVRTVAKIRAYFAAKPKK